VTNASRVVLIIEDEPQIRRVLRTLLELAQFRVVEAENATRGLREALSRKPDLILIDLGLPDGDGLEVIAAVRRWSRVPILVLSARSDEQNKVAALDAGADDYVTKPFGAKELMARLQVALRHAATYTAGSSGAATRSAESIAIGRWHIDLQRREARDDGGETVHLTPIEFRLLEVLSEHSGMVVTHQQMLRHVWGPGSAEQTHYLRVYMKQLRRKLEPDPARPRWLLTDTGVGYRLLQR